MRPAKPALLAGLKIGYDDNSMAQDVPIPDTDTQNQSGYGSTGTIFGNDRKAVYFVYGFFLVHMLAFGSAGFFMSYGSDAPAPAFNYLFSGFAISIYLIFYLVIFGLDDIGWLLINSALGVLGVLAQLDWILAAFGTGTSSYPWTAHIIPGIYYVLYTFLLRRMILHIFRVRDGTRKKTIVDGIYVAGSLLVYVPLLAF
ncbi:MAG: hypothetical protein HKN36_00755 [Hellea sp.]|nr:hypothetical protein [Hellea sp.]